MRWQVEHYQGDNLRHIFRFSSDEDVIAALRAVAVASGGSVQDVPATAMEGVRLVTLSGVFRLVPER